VLYPERVVVVAANEDGRNHAIPGTLVVLCALECSADRIPAIRVYSRPERTTPL